MLPIRYIFMSPILKKLVEEDSNQRRWNKEYILVIERTSPPSVFQRCAHATSPCSVYSIDREHQVVYSNYLTV